MEIGRASYVTDTMTEFQLGHVFSDMEIQAYLQENEDFNDGFQLGHVFSDMEICDVDRRRGK